MFRKTQKIPVQENEPATITLRKRFYFRGKLNQAETTEDIGSRLALLHLPIS